MRVRACTLDGHLAIPPGAVHGIDIGIEEDLVEVPHHDGEGGEDGFEAVDRGGNVDPPARKQVADLDFWLTALPLSPSVRVFSEWQVRHSSFFSLCSDCAIEAQASSERTSVGATSRLKRSTLQRSLFRGFLL